jgi:hypothetical protein
MEFYHREWLDNEKKPQNYKPKKSLFGEIAKSNKNRRAAQQCRIMNERRGGKAQHVESQPQKHGKGIRKGLM